MVLAEMSDYGIHPRAFFADNAEGYWIVDPQRKGITTTTSEIERDGQRIEVTQRKRNDTIWFQSAAERDAALLRDYGLKKSDFRKATFLEHIRSDLLFPWNLLFYALAAAVIFLAELFERREN